MNTSTLIHSQSIPVRSFRQSARAGLLCLLSIGPTWAAPTSVTVSFRDLDLSNIAGVTTLYHRIQSAAKQVCGYEPGADLLVGALAGLLSECHRRRCAQGE